MVRVEQKSMWGSFKPSWTSFGYGHCRKGSSPSNDFTNLLAAILPSKSWPRPRINLDSNGDLDGSNGWGDHSKRPTSYWKSGKIPDFGSGGVWGICELWIARKSVSRKLRITILLNLGLVTFRFRVGKTRAPFISRFSKFGDVSMTSQTNCFLFLEAPDGFK